MSFLNKYFEGTENNDSEQIRLFHEMLRRVVADPLNCEFIKPLADENLIKRNDELAALNKQLKEANESDKAQIDLLRRECARLNEKIDRFCKRHHELLAELTGESPMPLSTMPGMPDTVSDFVSPAVSDAGVEITSYDTDGSEISRLPDADVEIITYDPAEIAKSSFPDTDIGIDADDSADRMCSFTDPGVNLLSYGSADTETRKRLRASNAVIELPDEDAAVISYDTAGIKTRMRRLSEDAVAAKVAGIVHLILAFEAPLSEEALIKKVSKKLE